MLCAIFICHVLILVPPPRPQISAVPYIEKIQGVYTSIFIFDCIWELFVLVGSDARGKRKDIRLALSVADVSNFFPTKPISY